MVKCSVCGNDIPDVTMGYYDYPSGSGEYLCQTCYDIYRDYIYDTGIDEVPE
jgi:hypothetical protein